MDYEKAYKEALERAKQFMSEHPTRAEEDLMVALLPELRESEDERIRKELLEEIEFIIPHEDETDTEGLILPSYRIRIDKYKSYLEKQKELTAQIVAGFPGHHFYDGEKLHLLSTPAMEEKQYPKVVEFDHLKEQKSHCVAIDTCEAIDKAGEFDEWMQKEQKPADSEEKFESIDNAFRRGREVGFHEGVESVKQPAEWSKEDKKIYNRLVKHYEYLTTYCITTADRHIEIREELNFLKSLRPQPHWKPSEEEVNAFENLLKGEFPNKIFPGATLANLLNKLKKLYYNEAIPSNWKPSEEQMEALKEASASWMNQKMGNDKLLESLYNDLKKLM